MPCQLFLSIDLSIYMYADIDKEDRYFSFRCSHCFLTDFNLFGVKDSRHLSMVNTSNLRLFTILYYILYVVCAGWLVAWLIGCSILLFNQTHIKMRYSFFIIVFSFLSAGAACVCIGFGQRTHEGVRKVSRKCGARIFGTKG